jgi:hypothetical protein
MSIGQQPTDYNATLDFGPCPVCHERGFSRQINPSQGIDGNTWVVCENFGVPRIPRVAAEQQPSLATALGRSQI